MFCCGRDLTEIPGLAERVAADLERIVHEGMKKAVARVAGGE